MALRDEEQEISVTVYDCAQTLNRAAVAAMSRLAGDLTRMYQALGSDGRLAVKSLATAMAAPELQFGGNQGRIVMARLVGEKDEFVGGLCLTGLVSPRSEIRYLWVDPSFRGAGLGAQLINRAINFATKAKCDAIFAEILPELQAATHVFVASGFIYEGRSRAGRNIFVLHLSGRT